MTTHILDAAVGAALLGGWTFMWLLWLLQADARQWIVASVFPDAWRGATTRREICELSPVGLNKWLVTSSAAPLWAVQLLTCRYCMSAHVAWTGSIVWGLAAGWNLTLPLVWAAGAGIGNFLYGRATQIKNFPPH